MKIVGVVAEKSPSDRAQKHEKNDFFPKLHIKIHYPLMRQFLLDNSAIRPTPLPA